MLAITTDGFQKEACLLQKLKEKFLQSLLMDSEIDSNRQSFTRGAILILHRTLLTGRTSTFISNSSMSMKGTAGLRVDSLPSLPQPWISGKANHPHLTSVSFFCKCFSNMIKFKFPCRIMSTAHLCLIESTLHILWPEQ